MARMKALWAAGVMAVGLAGATPANAQVVLSIGSETELRAALQTIASASVGDSFVLSLRTNVTLSSPVTLDTRNFVVLDTAGFDLRGPFHNAFPSGFTKIGAGTLELASGAVSVYDGALRVVGDSRAVRIARALFGVPGILQAGADARLE